MAEEKPRLYEALFLLRQKEIASDFAGCVEHVREVLRRADAEVVALQKWDERRLAYDVKGQRRGTYFLSYFKVLPSKLIGMERDCNLSEIILRTMVLKADYVGDVELEAIAKQNDIDAEVQLRAQAAEAEATEAAAPAPAAEEAPAEEETPAAVAEEAPVEEAVAEEAGEEPQA